MESHEAVERPAQGPRQTEESGVPQEAAGVADVTTPGPQRKRPLILASLEHRSKQAQQVLQFIRLQRKTNTVTSLLGIVGGLVKKNTPTKIQ